MASLNAHGSILHGIGGGSASIDNAAFAHGAAGGWEDDRTAFFAAGDDNWVVSLFDAVTGMKQRAITDPLHPYFGQGGNTLFAGGGVWAAWLATGRSRRTRGPRGELFHVPYEPGRSNAGRGLYASTGFIAPEAGLLGVGPDGAIGYKPSYQSDGPSLVREVSGDEWQITPGHAADLMLLGGGRAVWQEGNRIHVRGIPQPQQLGSAWRPQAFNIAGQWWIAYWCDERGVVLHPFDSFDGYVLSPATVACWHYGRALDHDRLRFALSSGEGEQPGQVRAHDVDFSQPTVSLEPEPPPVIITEPPPVIEPPPVEPPPVTEPPPVVVEPIPPTPQPPMEDDMIAAYSDKVVPGFVPGTEIDNGNGTISIQKPNGKYLCVTPEGSVEERDSAGGLWESFRKGSNCIVAERDGEAKGPQVFVLMVVDI